MANTGSANDGDGQAVPRTSADTSADTSSGTPPGTPQRTPDGGPAIPEARPEPGPPAVRLSDPGQLSRSMADVAERSRRMVAEWLRRQGQAVSGSASLADPLGIGGAFLEMTGRLMANPARVMQAQIGFWQDYMTLWQTTTRRLWGLDRSEGPGPQPDAAGTPPPDADASPWKQAEVFDFVKQSYLLSARSIQDAFGRGGTLPGASRQKADFYARHFVEAMSPAHFLLTSPAMLRRTAETRGENLLRGLTSLLADLERGRSRLATTSGEAGFRGAGFRGAGFPDAGLREPEFREPEFRLGETVGTAPGKVIHQTAVMQLIQYAPATPRVLRRPLLIVPPWLGKFYVLDLQPRNSFVRWAVAQGHTVFMLSWADPQEAEGPGLAGPGLGDPGLGDPGFDDYVTAGVVAALEAIERATGERRVNALGYGLGGTLLAVACAWLARRGADRVASVTLLAAMLDFEQTGELGVFIDEEHLAGLSAEAPPAERAASAATHAMLRANDLIWSFVVNTYLAGNEAFPFDLLHWSADATRMPARLHGFYLRHLYRDNELARPDALELAGERIDLGRVAAPAYVLAARDDRISPWTSCWRGMRLLGGPARFVLAGSGHLSGVINPPGSGKYSHWINREAAADAESWFGGAVEIAGSWWSDWQRWVSAPDRETVAPRVPGAALEDAPGSFVQGRAA